jgi:putative tryptophan/tyrosine transport system substrate-binding protein
VCIAFGRSARIGVLLGYAETDSEAKALLGEFTHALSEFGWIERQNLWMDVRWAPAKIDLMRTFAKELVFRSHQRIPKSA